MMPPVQPQGPRPMAPQSMAPQGQMPPPIPSPPAMKKGGMVKGMDKAQDKAMIAKAFKQHDAQEHKGGNGTTLKLAKGGSASSRADGIATKGKTKGRYL